MKSSSNRVSLKQIADSAGVSLMTASRVLRGIGSVKPSTRQNVIEAASHLDDGRNSRVLFHKKVAGGKAGDHRLRLLLPYFRVHRTEPAKELSDRFINVLAEDLQRTGGTLVLSLCSGIEDVIAQFERGRFHGIVIRDSLPSAWFRRLVKITNVVSAVSNDFIPGCDCVFINESRAATEIFHQLSKRCHERVAWFGINDFNYIKQLEKIDPLRDTLGQIHVVRYAAWNSIASMGPTTELHRTLYLTRDHDRQSIEEVVAQGVECLFDNGEPPTAVVTPTEIMATNLIHILRQRGLDVPADCSVISYGRTKASLAHRPTLAGIRTNFDDLARVVPELIVRRLADPQARPLSISLEADFEMGTSLGRLH